MAQRLAHRTFRPKRNFSPAMRKVEACRQWLGWPPQPTLSGHPPESPCPGENWTVQVLDAVMQGPDSNLRSCL